MGRRGPPPKPTRIRALEGNPGRRPLNKREPKPRQGIPRCPAWLGPEAKAAWRRMIPELRRMKILTFADGEALAAFCQTYARWRAAEEFLVKHGDVYPIRDEQGRVKCMAQFPQVSIARHQLHLLKGFYQEFGMTPSARTRIAVGDDEKDDLSAQIAREFQRAKEM
jgi:P27 family predicted phage terminase small subunit